MDKLLDGEKVVLILEHSDHKLSSSKVGDRYVLEGVFCQFGIENNNKRIYEEREYLPHLEYLQEKIKLGNLTGQLDHPQDFEVRLSQASHLIESLQYDQTSRQVVGKVRLLSTSSGRDAKALIDDGVQLSISSRAAGVVESDRSVKIKRIFTYDLVADPGFANAQLNRLNESLGLDTRSSIQIYDLSEKYTNVDDAIAAVDTETKNQSSKMDPKFVTEEALNDYSIVIRNEFERLSKELEAVKTISESEGSDEPNSDNKIVSEFERMSKYINYLAEKLDQVIEYSNYLAENSNKLRKYSEYLAENLNGSIDYSEHIAEKVNKTQHYTNYLAENLDKSILYTEHVGAEVESQAKKLNESIKYTEYLAENLDKGIQYADYIAENVDKTQKFGNYLAENLDKSINYSNYLAEKLDNGLRYADYIAENVDKTQKYSNYLAEKLDQSIQHGDYISEHLDNAIRYAEYVAESVNISTPDTSSNVEEVVNESEIYTPTVGTNAPISDRIDAILESIRKQKVESVAKKNNYQFMTLLSEARQNEFLALNDTNKEKVVKALNESAWFGEGDILKIWNTAVSQNDSDLPKWISGMPVEYAPIWESLTSDEKTKIVAQSKMYNLETPYQIKHFWATRGLDANKSRTNVLNENVNQSGSISEVNDLGYSNDFVKGIQESLAQRFR